MSIRIENLKLDFADYAIKTIRLHQYDHNSTKIQISCTDHGNPVLLSPVDNTALFKWLKPDGNHVYKSADIGQDGTISFMVEEQMVIVKGTAKVEIQILEHGAVLHTMPFQVSIIGETFGDEVISEDDVSAVTDALSKIQDAITISAKFPLWEQAEAKRNSDTKKAVDDANSATQKALDAAGDVDKSKNYMLQAKSYAIGDSGVRDNEATDNAKYYAEQAKSSESKAKTSADAAVDAMDDAKNSADSIIGIEEKCKDYCESAKNSMTEAKKSETTASEKSELAVNSATNAKTSEDNAKSSETNAEKYYKLAQGWAAGYNDDTKLWSSSENAMEYAKQAKNYRDQASAIAGGNFAVVDENGKIVDGQIPVMSNEAVLKLFENDDFLSDY